MNILKTLPFTIGLFLTLLPFLSPAQCSVSSDNNDYTVEIGLTLIDVDVLSSSPCNYGYNYRLVIEYNLNYVGTNIPSNGLDNLQGNLTCGSTNLFFAIPSHGGTGTVYTAQNYIGQDCQNASPQNLNCNYANLTISYSGGGDGDDIKGQSLDCPPTFLSALYVKLNHAILSQNDENIYFDWSTLQEKNVDYFIVERFSEKQGWQTIGNVAAKGGELETHYSFKDEKGVSGKYFYKLKEVTTDGDTNFLDIQEISVVNKAPITLAPNPVVNELSIIGISDVSDILNIYNSMGYAMDVRSFPSVLYYKSLVLDVNTLESGVYFIQFKSGLRLKFIKT